MKLFKIFSSIALLLIFISCVNENVDISTGSIDGTVEIRGTGGLADVKLTLYNEKYGTFEAVTDANGNYSFKDVWLGRYKITAEKDGYIINPASIEVDLVKPESLKQNFCIYIAWPYLSGATRNDTGYFVKQLSDHSYIVAGNLSTATKAEELHIIKLDEFGTLVWDRTFGSDNLDIVNSLDETAEGDYVFAGCRVTRESNVFIQNYWVIKITSAGEFVWEKVIPPDANSSKSAYAVKCLPNENILIGGVYAGDPSTRLADIELIQLDRNGNVISGWNRIFGGAGNDMIKDIELSYSESNVWDGFIICGSKGGENGGKDYPWVFKIGKDTVTNFWSIIFNKNFGTGALYNRGLAKKITRLSDNSFMVVGQAETLDNDLWITSIDNGGNILWDKTFTHGGDDSFEQMIADGNGGLVCTGSYWSAENNTKDVLLMQLDGAGNERWHKLYDRSGFDDTGYDLCLTNDSGYAIAGVSWTSDNLTNLWVLKLNDLGEIPGLYED